MHNNKISSIIRRFESLNRPQQPQSVIVNAPLVPQPTVVTLVTPPLPLNGVSKVNLTSLANWHKPDPVEVNRASFAITREPDAVALHRYHKVGFEVHPQVPARPAPKRPLNQQGSSAAVAVHGQTFPKPTVPQSPTVSACSPTDAAIVAAAARLAALERMAAATRATTPARTPNKLWTGAASSDWFTASNWNPVGVPAETDDVGIGSSLTVQIGPADGRSNVKTLYNPTAFVSTGRIDA